MGCGSSRPPPQPELVGMWISCRDDHREELLRQFHLRCQRSAYKLTLKGYTAKAIQLPANNNKIQGTVMNIGNDGWLEYLSIDGREYTAYAGPITTWTDTRWVGCCPCCGRGYGCFSLESAGLDFTDSRNPHLVVGSQTFEKISNFSPA